MKFINIIKITIVPLFFIIVFIFCEKRNFKSPYDPKAGIKTNTPYELTAEVISDTEIKLQWKYKGPTIGFKIERKDSAKGQFKQLAQIEKDTTSYIDTHLKTDIHYYYRVKAFTASNESFADTDINHIFPVPSDLKAESLSDKEIKLTWQDSCSFEKGFEIERKVANEESWKQVGTVGKDSTLYVDSSLQYRLNYEYRVRDFTDSNYSGYSATISAATEFPHPSNLSAEPFSDSEIKLTWEDNCRFESGFMLERKDGNDDSWQRIRALGADTTAFNDSNLTYNTGYFYRVKAFTESNESDYSNTVLMSTYHPAPPLISPENEIVINKTVVSFSWKAFVNVSGYHIQIGNTPEFTNLEFESRDLTEASYTSPVLPEGTHYWRVGAKDIIGNWGSWSDVWQFTIDTQGPNAPTLYTPKRYAKLTNASPSFDWSDVNTAESYELLVDNNLYFNTPPEIHKTSLTSSEYIATESLANGRYHWKVRCKDNVGNYGDWSYVWHFDIDNQGLGTPILYKPENSTTVNDVAPSFDWSDVSEAVSYELIVDNNSDFGSSEIHQINLTSSEYAAISSLSNGTYYWKVRCKNSIGNWSAWSSIWSFIVNNSTEEWNQLFGSYSEDDGSSVQETSDGGFIITGYTYSYGAGESDLWLIKTDAFGKQIWNKTFGGASEDGGSAVQETSDGGFIITGSTKSFDTGSEDVWLIKTDGAGNEEWNKTFGGASWDYGKSIQETSDGGFIITGSTESFGAGSWDVWLIKTDGSGNEIWNHTFGGISNDWGYAVQEMSGSGYIITGYTESFGTGGTDLWVIKTDISGNEIWNQTFGGPLNEIGRSIQQSSDGGFIITGYTASFGAGNTDVWLLKLK